jgi:hypothetical protein
LSGKEVFYRAEISLFKTKNGSGKTSFFSNLSPHAGWQILVGTFRIIPVEEGVIASPEEFWYNRARCGRGCTSSPPHPLIQRE